MLIMPKELESGGTQVTVETYDCLSSLVSDEFFAVIETRA
jgi:hypothetical protein